MKIVEKEKLSFLEVRQLLDLLSLYKHTVRLVEIQLSCIKHDVPLYSVTYLEMEE